MHLISTIKKFCLTLIGILVFQSTFGQENYLAGYIIKIEGDTIQGFIDYRNWKRNPKTIRFNEIKDGNPVVYKVNDITEFNVKDEIYISRIVETEITPFNTNMLKEGSALKIKTDTVFLQTLFKGEKSLYYFKSSKGKDNFYIKTDSSIQLLIHKKYLTEANVGHPATLIAENKKYLGQLSSYLQDCSTILSKLKNTTYEKKSLEKLFNYYYKCSSSDIVFQKTTKKVTTEIGILAGITLSSLEFDEYGFPYLSKGEFNNSTDITGGIFFDIILPRNQGKWSINNELLFTSYKINGYYEDYDTDDVYSIITTKLNYSYLKLNTLIRFKYPIGNAFIYLNGGISNGYAVSVTNYKKTIRKIYTIESTKEGEAIPDNRKYEQGLVLGLGFKYDKFSFELRHERGNGMGASSASATSSIRNYFLLGYRF